MIETTNPFALTLEDIRRRMETLTPMQQEILYLMLQGHKLGDIPKMLESKWPSVDYNITKAIANTGAKNRAQLIAWYAVSSWLSQHRDTVSIAKSERQTKITE